MQFSKIREKIHVLVIALFILPAIPMAAHALPAFPGAMGWGSDTVGGRSPSAKLYKVNTLDDNSNGSCSGNICTGSLRYALTASGPRIVIFTVGGTITLGSTITVYDPYLNIAGQTAPGGGILLRGPNIKGAAGDPAINFYTHDVIVRGLRLRDTGDSGMTVIGNRDNSVGTSYNFIFDHNSLSWNNDSMVEAYYDANHVTFSYNIISEGTYEIGTVDGSEGALLGSVGEDCYYYTEDITFHHNLFAHNNARNPLIKHNTGPTEVINNVIYNWNWRGIETLASSYIAKNVIIRGPSTTDDWSHRGITVTSSPYCPGMLQPGSVMVTHNIGPDRPTDSGDDWLAVDGGTSQYRTDSPPFTLWGNTVEDVSTVKNTVLNNAGATVPYRDSVDVRVINDVINGTGSIPKWTAQTGPPDGYPTIASGTYPTDTDGDGMPDAWEKARGLNPNDPSDWNKDRDGDGYLNIEEYINSFFPAIVSPLPPPSALIPNPPSIIGVN